MRNILLSIVLVLLSWASYAQCDVSVDVPADITICEEDDVDLEGIINGTESCFAWVSDQGYFNDSDLDPTVFVDVNTTFTFAAWGSVPGPNLIDNGDFEAGDGTFDTDYTPAIGNCFHGAGFLGCEGVYEIMDDPSLGHNNFDPCAPMGGLQMVVNGAASLQLIWCQEVDVEEGKKYEFSAWGQSVNPGSPAQLQFSIDGQQIGSILGLSTSTCNWEQIQEFWIANSTGSVEICVTNQNTAAGGNDFAIDDIFFGELCSDEKEIEVTVGDLSIDPIFPEIFDCTTDEIELNLNVDGSFPPFDFVWTSPDFNVIDDDNNGNAFVFEPGTYIVEVTDALGCMKEHFFDVEDDLTTPQLEINPIDAVLLCDDAFINIFNEFDDSDYDYEWDWEGDSYSTDNVLQAEDPGFYEVTVTDVTNGCTTTANFTVGIDDDIPEIEASFSNPIDCNSPSSELIVTSNDPINSIEWFDEFGDPVPNTTVTIGGFYTVTVVGDNGCITDDFITIPVNEFDPQIMINDPGVLNCDNPTTTLTISANGTLNFDWSGPNMFTASGNDILIDAPGTYVLIASDNAGCSVDFEVEILGDFIDPTIELGPIGILDCDVPSIPLTVNNFNPNNQYLWTLPNDTELSGQSIDASLAGEYNLLATASNGCTAETTINLQPAGNLPVLDLNIQEINCMNDQANLSATGSFNSITWSDVNGPITDLNVTEEGWYYAFADNGGGCDVLDSVFLNVDTITPQQNILIPIINCDTDADLLFNSLDDNYNYLWTLPDGNTSTQDTITATLEGNYQVLISSENGCTNQQSFVVDSDVELPEYQVNGIETLNCLIEQIELEVDSISDLSSVTLIDPMGVNQNNSLIIQSGGTHVIEFIGTNGCIDSFEFNIPIDTIAPNPILQNTNIDCINQTAFLAVTNPNLNQSYEWTNTQENLFGDSFETDEEGLVTLYTTDLTNWCMDTIETLVVVDTISPTLSYQVPQLTCVAQEAEIMVFPNGNYDYEWTLPNQETASGMVLIAQDTGIYDLVLTGENGCTNQYQIPVAGNIEIPEFDVVPPTPIDCNNETTLIQIESDEPLAGFTATLDGNSFSFGNGELVTDQPGSWSVQVTAPSGCTATADFEIVIDTIPASPSINVQDIDCANTTGLMTIVDEDPSSNYLWVDSNGDIWPMSSFIPEDEQLVYLQELPSNGCLGIDSAFISIDTISPSLELSSSLITCQNTNATIEVINPSQDLEYLWQYNNEDIETSSSFSSNQTGIYTAIATNTINNCSTELSIEVLADQNIPVDFDFSLTPPPCGEEEYVISNLTVDGGSGPYIYSTEEENPAWFPDDMDLILLPGENFVQVQDSNGCILDTIINLTLPIPVEAEIDEDILIVWASDTTLQLMLNKPLDQIESILWTPSIGLSCDDCPNPIVNLEENQNYQILVTDINGCEDIVDVRVEVLRIISVYLPNVFTPDNQDNNLFFPFSTEQHITNVDNFYIYDRWGNRVFANHDFLPNDPSAGWDGTILGADATPGVYAYILEIFYADGTSEIIANDVTLLRLSLIHI